MKRRIQFTALLFFVSVVACGEDPVGGVDADVDSGLRNNGRGDLGGRGDQGGAGDVAPDTADDVDMAADTSEDPGAPDVGPEVSDCGAADGGLFISEIVDPNISDPQRGRFIELYNGGNRPVPLAGLEIVRHFDPEGALRSPLPNESVPACGTFVIADNELDFQLLYGRQPNWVPPRDGTRGIVDNNGDDAVAVGEIGGAIIDQFGVPAESSGFPSWSYDDSVVRRAVGVTRGAATFDVADWVIEATGEGSIGTASPGTHTP